MGRERPPAALKRGNASSRLQQWALCPLLLLLLLLLPRFVQAQPPHTPAPRVVLVICDALTVDDLNDPHLPALYALARAGAVGLMNCATVGDHTPTAAALALALGQLQPASPSDELAFQAGESAPGEFGSAGAAYARRTGQRPSPERQVVHLGIASLTRRGLNGVTVGAALTSASPPVRALICGNADTDRPGRRAALLALDAMGEGAGDVTLCRPAADLPYGRTDADPSLIARYAAEADAGLFVAQLGDTARLEAVRASRAPGAYRAVRTGALHRLDAFLYLLQARLADEAPDSDVMLVSPYPPADSAGRLGWSRLTPILAWGPDFPPGLLTSATTRTSGLIANIDVAPTLLTLLRVPLPVGMVGRAMRSGAGADGPTRMAALTRMDYVASLNGRAVTAVMAPLGGACFLLGLIGLAVRRWSGVRMARRFAPIMVYAQNLPAALMLSPLLVPPTLLEYGLRIAAWMATLTLVCCLLARPLRMAPPVIAALLCVLLVMGDTLAGQPLVKESLLSGYALSGIRFYGVGNEYLGVLLGMALAGGFAWLDDCAAPFPPDGSARRERIALLTLWAALALMLGWPGLGANAGSLIITVSGFGVGALALGGRRPALAQAVGLALSGLLLSFAFGALDALLARQASSQSGAALTAAAHGRGAVYLAQIALRKMAMNLRLLFSPYLLLGASIVVTTVVAARLLIGAEIRALMARRPWAAQGLPALLTAIVTSLLFKDSGVVTVTFMIGSATVITLWYVLTQDTTAS